MNFFNSEIRSTAMNKRQNNAYLAHEENIHLTMLADDDDESVRG